MNVLNLGVHKSIDQSYIGLTTALFVNGLSPNPSLFSFQEGSSSLKLVDLLWSMHLFSPTKVLWFVNCLADSCFCWISAEKKQLKLQ